MKKVRVSDKLIYFLVATTISFNLVGCSRNTKNDNVFNPTVITDTDFPSEIETENNEEIITTENLDRFVSEEFYNNLKLAKEKFYQVFSRGSLASQLINGGINLNSDEVAFIDGHFSKCYELICNYVDSFERGDFKNCFDIGNLLFDEYFEGLNKNYLYNLIFQKQVPEEFRSQISFGENYNIYDLSHNINLENGKKIRIVGLDEDLIASFDTIGINYDFGDLTRWFLNLPDVLFYHYLVINQAEDNDICYIVNETVTEAALESEWTKLKAEGSEMYGFLSDTTIITKVLNSDGNEVFVFQNSEDGTIYGELDYDQLTRANKFSIVEEALITGNSDILLLDSYIKDLINCEKQEIVK